MTTKRYIARAPVTLGGRDVRPGDNVPDDVDHKLMKDDLEAGRIEEVAEPTDDARKQHHVNAVMGAIEKAADAIASDKVAAAREDAEKAARDRQAAERAQAKAAAPADATDTSKAAGPAVLASDGKLHASGTLKDGKPVDDKGTKSKK